MLTRIRTYIRGNDDRQGRGFLGWEMVVVIGAVFVITAFALYMLRKSYKACTDEGYGLLECVFNAPEQDPYDTKAKADANAVSKQAKQTTGTKTKARI